MTRFLSSFALRSAPARGLRSRIAAAVARRRALLWLALVVGLAARLRLARVGEFDNEYYTATVASMLKSPGNFLFGAFDPGGVVMVDKPPFSFWVEAVPAALFGVRAWSVTVSQAVLGTLAVLVLYVALRATYGSLAGFAGALTLAVLPASVVIDSRNEPDALLSFVLVLAAAAIIRAVRTGRWRWLVVFAVLMGIGFNTKMLVAFVPLPAFLLYYLVAARGRLRRVVLRAAATGVLVAAASLAWVAVVALTPAGERPYIGSTPDNSIWTLVFGYNGIERFTSFIGPRRAPMTVGGAGGSAAPAAGPDGGLFGLLGAPLASQLGWLLPLGLAAMAAGLAQLLSPRVYERPAALFAVARGSPAAAQALLWTGWLATGLVIFGLARSTTTHPYYLVGLAAPLSAVIGIGLAALWRAYRRGGLEAWLPVVVLAGAAVYQAHGARGILGEWATLAVLAGAATAMLVMAAGLRRGLARTPLARAAFILGCAVVLLVPVSQAMTPGGRIVGPGAGPGAAPPGPLNPSRPGADPRARLTEAVASYIEARGDAGSTFALASVNARETAPFIIRGVPALAVGGFSGADPIFTPESFRALVERGEVRYFLMPDPGTPAAPGARNAQRDLLSRITREWEDVSRDAGLPPGRLYRHRAP